MSKAVLRLSLVGLSVFSISAIAAYNAVLNPLSPNANDSTTVTLVATYPDWVFDSSGWITEAGGDITANFYCQSVYGPPSSSSMATLGVLSPGHHTIHVWCWYDNLMKFIPVEVASLPVDIPSPTPLNVPATSDLILIAQGMSLVLGALLVLRRNALNRDRGMLNLGRA